MGPKTSKADDEPRYHPAGVVSGLRTLGQATAVDVLSSSTRGELDKLLFTALLGYVVAVSKITKVSIGGFDVEQSMVWAVPVAIALINIYLIFSFGILALADIWRWQDTYKINSEPVKEVKDQLEDQAQNPDPTLDDDPVARSEYLAVVDEAAWIARTMQKTIKLEKFQIYVSVCFPIAFSLTAVVLVTINFLVLGHVHSGR